MEGELYKALKSVEFIDLSNYNPEVKEPFCPLCMWPKELGHNLSCPVGEVIEWYERLHGDYHAQVIDRVIESMEGTK